MKQYLSFLICVLLLGVINLPAAPPSIKTKLIRYTELEYSWVTITVENKYGIISETLGYDLC